MQMHAQNSLREGILPARSITALEGRCALWFTGCGWGEGNTVKISFSLFPWERWLFCTADLLLRLCIAVGNAVALTTANCKGMDLVWQDLAGGVPEIWAGLTAGSSIDSVLNELQRDTSCLFRVLLLSASLTDLLSWCLPEWKHACSMKRADHEALCWAYFYIPACLAISDW